MSQIALNPSVGNWVSGDDFYGREVEVEEVCSLLRTGHSLSISAPRRVGKTSLMREVVRRLNAEGQIRSVFVDVEAAVPPEEVIAEIATSCARLTPLAERVKGWATSLLANVEVDLQFAKVDLSTALASTWQTRGAQLLHALCVVDGGLVLVLDELPVFLAGLLRRPGLPPSSGHARSDADVFLSWLRSQAQAHGARLRLVVMGSIGLGPLLADAGLSATMNTLRPLRVDPWSPEVTLGALRALSASQHISLPEAAARRVLALLGVGVPFHVQLFHAELVDDARRRGASAVSVDDVRRVWDHLVHNPSHDLPHWEQRLRKALSPEAFSAALALLTEAAVAEPLTAERAVEVVRLRLREEPNAEPKQVAQRLLRLLEHDGYLAKKTDGWYFPFRLLRVWWETEHGPFQEA